MKLTCTQENLTQGLNAVAHIASKNTNLPILNNILIRAEKGGVELSATNLEIAITSRVRGKVEHEGAFTVPARLLAEYVNLLEQGQVTIELDGATLLIQSGAAQTKLRGMPPEEFPLIPVVDATTRFRVAAGEFREAVGQVVFAAATDDTRPEISGVFLNFSEKTLTMAATDSYRLAERTLALIENENNQTMGVIVPAKTLQELVRLLMATDDALTFCLTQNQALFLTQESRLVSRLIDGQYPDYRQIVPTAHQTRCVVETAEFVQAVRATSLFSRPGINDLALAFSPERGTIDLTAANAQVGENHQTVKADVGGDANTIVFNGRYLLDGLTTVPTDRVVFAMTNSASPGILRGDGDEQFLYIIMPIKQ